MLASFIKNILQLRAYLTRGAIKLTGISFFNSSHPVK